MSDQIINYVNDPWRKRVGSWGTAPLDISKLTAIDVGRRVIYLGKPELYHTDLGIIKTWRNGLVFVRFGEGYTAAACNPRDLVFAILPCDGVAFPEGSCHE